MISKGRNNTALVHQYTHENNKGGIQKDDKTFLFSEKFIYHSKRQHVNEVNATSMTFLVIIYTNDNLKKNVSCLIPLLFQKDNSHNGTYVQLKKFIINLYIAFFLMRINRYVKMFFSHCIKQYEEVAIFFIILSYFISYKLFNSPLSICTDIRRPHRNAVKNAVTCKDIQKKKKRNNISTKKQTNNHYSVKKSGGKKKKKKIIITLHKKSYFIFSLLLLTKKGKIAKIKKIIFFQIKVYYITKCNKMYMVKTYHLKINILTYYMDKLGNNLNLKNVYIVITENHNIYDKKRKFFFIQMYMPIKAKLHIINTYKKYLNVFFEVLKLFVFSYSTVENTISYQFKRIIFPFKKIFSLHLFFHIVMTCSYNIDSKNLYWLTYSLESLNRDIPFFFMKIWETNRNIIRRDILFYVQDANNNIENKEETENCNNIHVLTVKKRIVKSKLGEGDPKTDIHNNKNRSNVISVYPKKSYKDIRKINNNNVNVYSSYVAKVHVRKEGVFRCLRKETENEIANCKNCVSGENNNPKGNNECSGENSQNANDNHDERGKENYDRGEGGDNGGGGENGGGGGSNGNSQDGDSDGDGDDGSSGDGEGDEADIEGTDETDKKNGNLHNRYYNAVPYNGKEDTEDNGNDQTREKGKKGLKIVNRMLKNLSLMSFNTGLLEYKIWGVCIYQNPPFISNRLLHIPIALKKTNADIIALQEVYDEKHVEYLKANLMSSYPFYARDNYCSEAFEAKFREPREGSHHVKKDGKASSKTSSKMRCNDTGKDGDMQHDEDRSSGKNCNGNYCTSRRIPSCIGHRSTKEENYRRKKIFALHHGLLVFSKYPIIYSCFHNFEHVTYLENLFGTKGFLEVIIDVPFFSHVTLVNMHLASGAADTQSKYIEKVRDFEIKQIMKIARNAEKRNTIPIIIGDLNAAPNLCPNNYSSFIKRGWKDAWLYARNVKKKKTKQFLKKSKPKVKNRKKTPIISQNLYKALRRFLPSLGKEVGCKFFCQLYGRDTRKVSASDPFEGVIRNGNDDIDCIGILDGEGECIDTNRGENRSRDRNRSGRCDKHNGNREHSSKSIYYERLVKAGTSGENYLDASASYPNFYSKSKRNSNSTENENIPVNFKKGEFLLSYCSNVKRRIGDSNIESVSGSNKYALAVRNINCESPRSTSSIFCSQKNKLESRKDELEIFPPNEETYKKRKKRKTFLHNKKCKHSYVMFSFQKMNTSENYLEGVRSATLCISIKKGIKKNLKKKKKKIIFSYTYNEEEKNEKIKTSNGKGQNKNRECDDIESAFLRDANSPFGKIHFDGTPLHNFVLYFSKNNEPSNCYIKKCVRNESEKNSYFDAKPDEVAQFASSRNVVMSKHMGNVCIKKSCTDVRISCVAEDSNHHICDSLTKKRSTMRTPHNVENEMLPNYHVEMEQQSCRLTVQRNIQSYSTCDILKHDASSKDNIPYTNFNGCNDKKGLSYDIATNCCETFGKCFHGEKGEYFIVKNFPNYDSDRNLCSSDLSSESNHSYTDLYDDDEDDDDEEGDDDDHKEVYVNNRGSNVSRGGTNRMVDKTNGSVDINEKSSALLSEQFTEGEFAESRCKLVSHGIAPTKEKENKKYYERNYPVSYEDLTKIKFSEEKEKNRCKHTHMCTHMHMPVHMPNTNNSNNINSFSASEFEENIRFCKMILCDDGKEGMENNNTKFQGKKEKRKLPLAPFTKDRVVTYPSEVVYRGKKNTISGDYNKFSNRDRNDEHNESTKCDRGKSSNNTLNGDKNDGANVRKEKERIKELAKKIKQMKKKILYNIMRNDKPSCDGAIGVTCATDAIRTTVEAVRETEMMSELQSKEATVDVMQITHCNQRLQVQKWENDGDHTNARTTPQCTIFLDDLTEHSPQKNGSRDINDKCGKNEYGNFLHFTKKWYNNYNNQEVFKKDIFHFIKKIKSKTTNSLKEKFRSYEKGCKNSLSAEDQCLLSDKDENSKENIIKCKNTFQKNNMNRQGKKDSNEMASKNVTISNNIPRKNKKEKKKKIYIFKKWLREDNYSFKDIKKEAKKYWGKKKPMATDDVHEEKKYNIVRDGENGKGKHNELYKKWNHKDSGNASVRVEDGKNYNASSCNFESEENSSSDEFTWDPLNPLNVIGPHSRCNGLRCDYIFFPPISYGKEKNNKKNNSPSVKDESKCNIKMDDDKRVEGGDILHREIKKPCELTSKNRDDNKCSAFFRNLHRIINRGTSGSDNDSDSDGNSRGARGQSEEEARHLRKCGDLRILKHYYIKSAKILFNEPSVMVDTHMNYRNLNCCYSLCMKIKNIHFVTMSDHYAIKIDLRLKKKHKLPKGTLERRHVC
ncbi:endonuclease/exonuclease/phosphatase domain containing protein [Plasmodium ovale curtisi]|uniref:Endonuclease/exonuclease/phosphatase domain containing protein n=2 Tax=Plasmodium ovale curtisi TaxID=864141 RepID=A0A1A8W0S8_PLAOA|nr:endonuclease/exonuclease/phosphatase domain containing protein [Plasmodium ovale curtisi]